MVTSQAPSKPFHLEEIAATATSSVQAHARELLLEYGRFVFAQPGAARFCFASLESEAARLPLSFIEQGGGWLLADGLSGPVGLVAWRALPATLRQTPGS